MKSINDPIRNKILAAALPDVAFDGWTLDVLERAAFQAGYESSMAHSVFPGGVDDAIAWFSHWADEAMLKALKGGNAPAVRVRDLVAQAVWARFTVLGPHKEAVRLAMAWWARPFRKVAAARALWATADEIWIFAGDKATDYNRYTKRSLLCGVLASTTLYWLNDASQDHEDSRDFLDRRIENVLVIGKIVGKLKKA